jgi:glycosyltransferase involved in cell wall biosynthesis
MAGTRVRVAFVVQGFGYGRGRATTAVELAVPHASAGHQVEAYTTAVTSRHDLEGVRVRRWRDFDAGRRYDVIVYNSGLPAAVLAVLGRVRAARLMCQHSYNTADPGLKIAHKVWYPSRTAMRHDRGRGYVRFTVPPPINPDRYRVPGAGTKVGLCLSSPHKGGAIVAHVARALPRVNFLVVKDPRGHGVSLFRGLGNVELVNFTDPRDFYAACRIQLFPSRSETYGRVAVEGAVSGIPVVASTHPAIREAMAGHGVFLGRADLDRWVSSVGRLMADPGEWRSASRDVARRGAAVRYREDQARFRREVEDMGR